jgi:hypothetical protein
MVLYERNTLPPFGSGPGGPSDKKRACCTAHTNITSLKSLKTKDKGKTNPSPLRVSRLTTYCVASAGMSCLLRYACLLRCANKHQIIEIKTLKSKPLRSKALGSKNKRQNPIKGLRKYLLARTHYWV